MSAKDFLKSGALGVIPAVIADNPKLVGGFDVLKASLKNREEEKAANAANAASPVIKAPTVGMKKGGPVSASRRADGIAQRGKTKGRMI